MVEMRSRLAYRKSETGNPPPTAGAPELYPDRELRQFLNGHEEGNLGYKPRKSLRATAPALDPTEVKTCPLRPENCLIFGAGYDRQLLPTKGNTNRSSCGFFGRRKSKSHPWSACST